MLEKIQHLLITIMVLVAGASKPGSTTPREETRQQEV